LTCSVFLRLVDRATPFFPSRQVLQRRLRSPFFCTRNPLPMHFFVASHFPFFAPVFFSSSAFSAAPRVPFFLYDDVIFFLLYFPPCSSGSSFFGLPPGGVLFSSTISAYQCFLLFLFLQRFSLPVSPFHELPAILLEVYKFFPSFYTFSLSPSALIQNS